MEIATRHRPTFRAKLVLGGPESSAWLGLAIPGWAAEEIGAVGIRFPVWVDLDGEVHRSWLRRTVDGGYVLYVNLLVKQRRGLRPGDIVNVTIEADTEPRGLGMPEELRTMLDEDPLSAHAFQQLPYYERREVVRYVQEARTTIGRAARVGRVERRLRSGRGG